MPDEDTEKKDLEKEPEPEKPKEIGGRIDSGFSGRKHRNMEPFLQPMQLSGPLALRPGLELLSPCHRNIGVDDHADPEGCRGHWQQKTVNSC